MKLEPHPFADLFPLMEGAPFDELVADIKANGFAEWIVLHEGKILDGRNRYRALVQLGYGDQVRRFSEAFEGRDPLAFVISKNLKRRHLNESQRAMIGATVENMPAHRPKAANLHTSRAAAAKLVNVSERSIASAAVVRDKGEPELQRAVNQGKLAISLAAQAAKLPPALQREVAREAETGRDSIVQNVVHRARRAEREATLGAKQCALPGKKYGVIVTDNEWEFEAYSSETGLNRSAADHYPTSDLETLKRRDVPSISADDCVLFMWSPSAMVARALEVMTAWDFGYRSQVIWRKDKTGLGYWFRNEHEILLVGTRGKIPAPAMGTQWPSVIDAPVGEHSAKPEIFLELIEAYFPTLPKIELNRRGPARPGWDAWATKRSRARPPNESPRRTAAQH